MISSVNSPRLGGKQLALLIGLAVLLAASRWFLRARVPDDYDSFGFVLALSDRYDLQAYQPQFPGYPVYLALAACAQRLGLSALDATEAVSALASVVSGLALAICAGRQAGPRAAFAVLCLHLVAYSPWLLGGSALSESCALALAASMFACLATPRPHALAGGILAGLLLGARASYWPLAVSAMALAPAGRRRAFALAGVLAALVWALPFIALVGPHEMLRLGSIHLRGHFQQWGGSVATRPDLALRAFAFARDLFYDGLAPSLIALGVVLAAVVVTLARGRSGGLRELSRALALAIGPYALWIFVAQNLVEQPRHALPLVEGLVLWIGCVLVAEPGALLVASAAMALAAAPLLLERRRVLPAGAQAARWVAEQGAVPTALVAAARSARFFRALGGGVAVQEHAELGDLAVSLSRMDRFPRQIFVTSEVDLSAARGPRAGRWQVKEGPTFCRDARLDRARPCLGLSTLQWSLK